MKSKKRMNRNLRNINLTKRNPVSPAKTQVLKSNLSTTLTTKTPANNTNSKIVLLHTRQ